MEIDDRKLSLGSEATDRIKTMLNKAGQYLESFNAWAHPYGTSIQFEEEEKLAQEFGGRYGRLDGWGCLYTGECDIDGSPPSWGIHQVICENLATRSFL